MSIADYNNIFSKPFTKQITLDFGDNLVLTNSDICSEEMSLEESLCSDSELRYGACEASCFKVRVVNSTSFVGKTVTVSIQLAGVPDRWVDSSGNYIVDSDEDNIVFQDSSSSSATIQLGKYKVYSDTPSNDRMWRDLVCYDAMYDILNADMYIWYNNRTFPMTIAAFRNSFFNNLGITQETTTLINDSLEVQGGFIVEDSLAGKTIIESICEINGVFGHINRSGKFEYISLPSSETVTYPWYIDGTGTYEDYETEQITEIVTRSEDGDTGTSVGTNGNTWLIENNPLIYGTEGTQTLGTALTNLLQNKVTTTYRPFKVETFGNPMLPVGTSVVINTKKYDPENGYSDFQIESLVMRRVLTGIQGMKDSIEATGEQYRPSVVNSMQSQLTRTKGRVHVVENTVDGLRSEVSTIGSNLFPLMIVDSYTADPREGGFVLYNISDASELDYANIGSFQFSMRGITLQASEQAYKKELDMTVRGVSRRAMIRNEDGSFFTGYVKPGEYLTLKYETRTISNVDYRCYWILPDSYSTSLIEQTDNQIVLKVDSSGNLVEAALGADPSTGSSFSVKADNINFQSYTFNLGTQNIEITSSNLTIDDTGLTVTGTLDGYTSEVKITSTEFTIGSAHGGVDTSISGYQIKIGDFASNQTVSTMDQSSFAVYDPSANGVVEIACVYATIGGQSGYGGKLMLSGFDADVENSNYWLNNTTYRQYSSSLKYSIGVLEKLDTYAFNTGTYTTKRMYGVSGFITNSSKDYYLDVPLNIPKYVNSISVSYVTADATSGGLLRTTNGRVGGTFSGSSMIEASLIKEQGVVRLHLSSTNAFTTVNNVPVAGEIDMTFSLSS